MPADVVAPKLRKPFNPVKLTAVFLGRHRLVRHSCSAALFFTLLFIRRSAQLLHPQVWDEDGTQILPELLRHGFKSIFTPVNGYLVLVPKLISAVAVAISGSHYPFVSTLLAWTFIVAVCLAISYCPTSLQGGALLGAATLLVPTNPEVFGIPLYTLWWAGLLLFLAVLWKPGSKAALWRAIFVLIGGLSSPIVFVAAPLLCIRAIIRRKREEAIVAVAAIVCCFAQTAALLQSGASDVPGGTGRLSFQQIPVKFIGSYLAGSLIRSTDHLLWLATAAFAAFLIVNWRFLRRRPEYLWLCGLWLGTTMLISVRVDIAILNTRWAGPRYFFLPFALISWFLVSVLFDNNQRQARGFAAVLLLTSLLNLYPVISRPQQDLHWAQQLSACARAESYTMQVSFDGEKTWQVQLSGEECRKLQNAGVLHTRNSEK